MIVLALLIEQALELGVVGDLVLDLLLGRLLKLRPSEVLLHLLQRKGVPQVQYDLIKGGLNRGSILALGDFGLQLEDFVDADSGFGRENSASEGYLVGT